jgi:hypothetical protein
MNKYPLKDKRAKTGSNLRGNPIAAHRAKLLGEMRKSARTGLCRATH